MKFSLALLALSANADDKKFVNKNKFMSATPPRWWAKQTPTERFVYIGDNLNNIFETHFDGTNAEGNLKGLLVALWFEYLGSCDGVETSR